MVRLAGVKAIRYIGKAPKKLWEVGGRNVPILNRGDVVLVGETVALSLTRGRFFIPVEGEITMDIAPLEELPVDENQEGENQEGENLPADLEASEAATDIAGFTDEEINTAFDAPQSNEAGNVTLEEAQAEEVNTKKKGK